ncbi:multicopper oxidase domain-containing protein [Halodesulfovibrio spirochaetisodalis]|uniref:multicopper oxidase domain-containing protein n=1 Tax=Halodesulfovibrio spirochaetisodalis TaxID=1560234 RepID=UPI000831D1E3|nr:multicopper oxidase domain-containing protein [Halodesulfovibrio spirochaetisodalis]
MHRTFRDILIYVVFFLLVFFAAPTQAKVVEYHLSIAEQPVNITGTSVPAVTVNGQIPAPTLVFTEGDCARIHVHNTMDVPTSVHWHGMLVPPNMDGVPYVSFPPIKPHTTFTYEYPIRQHGTYWYHSHTGFQEQRGLYGSIVVHPKCDDIVTNRDEVIVLSDWTDTSPDFVYRWLKRGSDAPSLQKGASQSIVGAARIGMLGDYLMRELRRMPDIDIADIAYDRFLANGKPQSRLPAKPCETIRLRIINGSASTFFLVEFAGGPMTIISADGQRVEPVDENRFLISVAETYDVIITVPPDGTYEFRATAQDGSAHASVWIGEGPLHAAPDIPKPNLYHQMGKLTLGQLTALTPNDVMGLTDARVATGIFDTPGRLMHSKKMGSMKSHADDVQKKTFAGVPASIPCPHPQRIQSECISQPPCEKKELTYPIPDSPSGKKYTWNFKPLASDVASSTPLVIDGSSSQRPWPPYNKLRALHNTNFSPHKTARNIRMTLDGDMERYVWMINGKVLSESDSIRIHQGEKVRFTMINRTMMHHPMHLHGHFFRVINGQGDYSPLKHTVDVAPLSTTVIEFDANEFGDWFFHCHLLYHLEAGMARVVHYEGFQMDPALAAVRPNLYDEHWTAFGEANILSNTTEGFVQASSTRHIFMVTWEIGWQIIDYVESEFIGTYDYYVNRFFSPFIGGDMFMNNTDTEVGRGVIGIRYLLPFNIDSRTWVDTEGGARCTLEKTFQLTPRLAIKGEAQFDTHDYWEGIIGAYYIISDQFSLMAQWHSDYGWGGGFQVQF